MIISWICSVLMPIASKKSPAVSRSHVDPTVFAVAGLRTDSRLILFLRALRTPSRHRSMNRPAIFHGVILNNFEPRCRVVSALECRLIMRDLETLTQATKEQHRFCSAPVVLGSRPCRGSPKLDLGPFGIDDLSERLPTRALVVSAILIEKLAEAPLASSEALQECPVTTLRTR